MIKRQCKEEKIDFMAKVLTDNDYLQGIQAKEEVEVAQITKGKSAKKSPKNKMDVEK